MSSRTVLTSSLRACLDSIERFKKLLVQAQAQSVDNKRSRFRELAGLFSEGPSCMFETK
jgi:hypothetical protein